MTPITVVKTSKIDLNPFYVPDIIAYIIDYIRIYTEKTKR